MKRIVKLFAACSALLLGACVSTEPRQLVPSISLSPENVLLADNDGAAQRPGVDFGISGAVNESDSLTNIAILPGVRVRAVTPGGVAERAGIRAGDIILSVDGQATDHPDVLAALALETLSARSFEFEMRRNTTAFMATLDVQPALNQQLPAVELYRADPVLTRAGYSTETLDTAAGQRISGARIVRQFEHTPLNAAGLRTDDVILFVDGKAVQSAQGLVSLLNNDYQPGDRVSVQYVRDNQIADTTMRLWHPGRRLSRLGVWPLFSYESTLRPDQTRLKIGDLVLISLFSYQRTGPEREYSLLGLIRGASGFGELLED
jgi:serine protease Do